MPQPRSTACAKRAGPVLRDRLEQQIRHAVVELFDQRRVEVSAYWSNSASTKAPGGALEAGARPISSSFRRSARAVVRIELLRHAPGFGGLVERARRLMHLAHAEPAQRPARCKLQCAEHQLGGRGMIARTKQHLGIVGAAVGQKVAGGSSAAVSRASIGTIGAAGYIAKSGVSYNSLPPQSANHYLCGRCAHATCFIHGPKGYAARPAASTSIRSGPVDRALITHGHSDHARSGHRKVLATRQTLDIMALRYGEGFAGDTQAVEYRRGDRPQRRAVVFHPAGHVLGSAQIEVEQDGLRIVASGDYKRQADPTCAPFEPVECDVFITEATFGLPVFRHPAAGDEIARLLKSAEQFPERSHLVGAYALGKAQRVIRLLRDAGYDRPIYIHGALAKISEYYQSEGIELGQLEAGDSRERAQGGFRRRYRGRAALGLPGSLGAALSRSGVVLRVGLDAYPPARQAGRRRAAADHLGPFRLGRADRHDRRDRRVGSLGHAWARGSAGALVRAQWHRGAAAAPHRLRG